MQREVCSGGEKTAGVTLPGSAANPHEKLSYAMVRIMGLRCVLSTAAWGGGREGIKWLQFLITTTRHVARESNRAWKMTLLRSLVCPAKRSSLDLALQGGGFDGSDGSDGQGPVGEGMPLTLDAGVVRVEGLADADDVQAGLAGHLGEDLRNLLGRLACDRVLPHLAVHCIRGRRDKSGSYIVS